MASNSDLRRRTNRLTSYAMPPALRPRRWIALVATGQLIAAGIADNRQTE